MNYQPSQTTADLIDLLKSRDQAGREKYGTTLDRTDLTPEEWAQHAVEESLDRAGYLVRWMKTAKELRDENEALMAKVKRLEEAGDEMDVYEHGSSLSEAWHRAKGQQ